MSDSVRPQRRQPTRLPHPWDSPGKNTGVGCHFLLQCMKGKSESEVAQSCPTLRDPMVCSLPGSSVHGICQARVLEWGAIAFSKKYSSLSIRFLTIVLSIYTYIEIYKKVLAPGIKIYCTIYTYLFRVYLTSLFCHFEWNVLMLPQYDILSPSSFVL